MVTPGLVPPFKTYREYFASEETNLFTENVATVMAPYALDPANAAAAHEPVALARQVYSSTMSGDPTAFLLCHLTLGFDSGDNPVRLGLVHSISRYDARIGRPASPWDDKAFGTQCDVVMRASGVHASDQNSSGAHGGRHGQCPRRRCGRPPLWSLHGG